MARSISSSISTLRSSLSDIKTAFNNVNVEVPSSLKVSQVDDYINQIDAKPPGRVIEITGEQFNETFSTLGIDKTSVKTILFNPYETRITGYEGLKWFGDHKELYCGKSPNNEIISFCYREDYNYSYKPYRIKIKDAKGMFEGFTNLKTVDLNYFDFSETTRTWNMFYNCSSLQYVNFNGQDLSKVTDMDSMFYGCSSLEYVCFDSGGKLIPKPTFLTNMFYNCTSLRSVVIPINPVNVSNASRMFYNCSKLSYICVASDYSDWTTNSSILNESELFYNCTSLGGYSSSKMSGAYAKQDSDCYFYAVP